ncbi:MAG: bifunctional DNA-formamidopyrimidine glycosylase/DNA-(apurinic or apyrimidinic site) lyase [Gammaproteobacteria bacterium]|nr:bifunctional DNA-formamidopyrimidine glycosylase/DNA-(apurinic or apyrimidinic site) lyase [Gammaproteobacteria bacterium]
MPELPEVEITRRGIAPSIIDAAVQRIIVRQRQLRWPVPRALERDLIGQSITDVDRRAKFILIRSATGTLITHLGMSGSLRVLPHDTPPRLHDHVDIEFDSGHLLRYTDPRRFGCLLWTRRDPLRHKLLARLGPEPLTDDFDSAYLYAKTRGRKAPIKQFIMNAAIVVGVGNIYASEALFLAGIHPRRAAGRISRARVATLVETIRKVLNDAIAVGGTTLRDFTGGDGQPGYFQLSLRVYDREGEACENCATPIRRIVLGQRSSFYCPLCQT